MNNTNKISALALTLLITGSIDSIRNLPVNALFGSSLIFFFCFAAIIFLIPTALVSAELSSNIDKGGVYQWVRMAFGEKTGFLAVWLQWVNNIVWFPTILSFIGGTAIYLIAPSLAENKIYMVSSVLVVFWALTLINLRGIRVSAKFASFCAITGLILPMAIIIALLAAWLILGNPVQIDLNLHSMLPDWRHLDTWSTLNVTVLSFAGMELATVHIADVKNPQSTFPKALAFSSIIIMTTMLMGSLAIAFVLPADKISLVNGTIQSFSYFLSAYHLSWMTPILTVLLIIGSLGGMISWIVSPVKGFAQAGEQGFMPKALAKENKHGMPQTLLLIQASLVSIVCLTFLFFPSVNGSYWFLTILSTQMYILMYILMFAAAFQLRKKIVFKQDAFRIPGKRFGTYSICILGIVGCFITLFTGFIPPSNIDIGNKVQYFTLFCGGMLAMLLPVGIFYIYRAIKAGQSSETDVDTDDDLALES